MSMFRLPKSFEAQRRTVEPPQTPRRAPDGITVCPKAVESIALELRRAKGDLLPPETTEDSTK